MSSLPPHIPESDSAQDSVTGFLRQYAPVPPEPHAEAEDQLMAAIAQCSVPDPLPVSPPSKVWRLRTAVATAIGVGLLAWVSMNRATWQTAQSPQPSSLTEAEQVTLERFLEETWGVVSYVDTTAIVLWPNSEETEDTL